MIEVGVGRLVKTTVLCMNLFHVRDGFKCGEILGKGQSDKR